MTVNRETGIGGPRQEKVREALDRLSMYERGDQYPEHAAALAEVEEWEARLARLTSRGIEDLHHSLAEAEAERDRLKKDIAAFLADPCGRTAGYLRAALSERRIPTGDPVLPKSEEKA